MYDVLSTKPVLNKVFKYRCTALGGRMLFYVLFFSVTLAHFEHISYVQLHVYYLFIH